MSILHTLMKYAVLVLLFPLRLLGVRKKQVMLISDLNGKYSDSPKYLTEFFLDKLPGLELVYALADPKLQADLQKKTVKWVKIGSFSYYVKAMTSRVFITNSGGISFIPFSKRTLVINTWHGGGNYKKTFLDYFPATPANVRSVKMTSRRTGKMLASCRAFSDSMEFAMLMPKEKFVPCGLPRNDIMFAPKEKQEAIKKALGLSGKRLCLYAPTFRLPSRNVFAGAVSGLYTLDTDKLCRVLSRRFGGEWVIGFRYHPKIKERRADFSGKVLDYSDYPDMQELLLAADVLINDYSSSMWDFALTGKPCFLLACDLADYEKKVSFYTPIRSLPFPLAENQEELFQKISSFDEKSYASDLKDHYRTLGSYETGTACQKVADMVRAATGL